MYSDTKSRFSQPPAVLMEIGMLYVMYRLVLAVMEEGLDSPWGLAAGAAVVLNVASLAHCVLREARRSRGGAR